MHIPALGLGEPRKGLPVGVAHGLSLEASERKRNGNMQISKSQTVSL